MKRFYLKQYPLILIFFSFFADLSAYINPPDSVYLFSYATSKNNNHEGLHFAWSIDQRAWHAIGPEYSYLRSDYGRWGAEKRMITPFLLQGADGLWHCVWSLNEKDGVFAHAASRDLIYWGRQSYPVVMQNQNCLSPEISFDKEKNLYTISWLSTLNGVSQVHSTTTTDFKTYTPAVNLLENSLSSERKKILISGNQETGCVHKVAWEAVDWLIKTQQLGSFHNRLYAESSKTDGERFASLQPVNANINVDVAKSKKISDLLLGIFFEDINYAADGGLYAEMVQNRGFEYALSDREGRDTSWHSLKAWRLSGGKARFGIDTVAPVHPNNKHYGVLRPETIGVGLVNEGFGGIAITAGEKYDFSVFSKMINGKPGKLVIRLIGSNGEIYAEAVTKALSTDWKKQEGVLIANATVSNARLQIIPQTTGSVALDMISLFPQKTFKGHKNGLRADLAQTIADIHPRFVRFPGGCVAHGDGLGNIYRWKNTIGPVETRKPQRNLWGYHQTAGLGYFEYFQFCENIGALPLPVIAAGVPCQNSATGGAGQQGGIPKEEMDEYIQDILDLIEYANGDVKTKWGKLRAEAGHPQPFHLKYIGIGNEDLITDIFEERFTMIYNVLKEKHPEITVIGTVGPTFEGTDYEEGWQLANKLAVPMVDEHYYQSPGWFIHNQDYYAKYDRSKSKVYLGEYAAHLPGRPTNIETALAEALYLTSLERNGDVVSMASYAPLLAKEGNTQWNPNLIYFNNTEVKPTVDYYVQQLFGQNSGDEYIESSVNIGKQNEAVSKRIAVSVVRDSKNNDLIVKLVNMLPVIVNTQVKLEGAGNISSSASQIVLTGTPDDKKARPVVSILAVSNNFPCTLPAYSFTLIRIKNPK